MELQRFKETVIKNNEKNDSIEVRGKSLCLSI